LKSLSPVFKLSFRPRILRRILKIRLSTCVIFQLLRERIEPFFELLLIESEFINLGNPSQLILVEHTDVQIIPQGLDTLIEI